MKGRETGSAGLLLGEPIVLAGGFRVSVIAAAHPVAAAHSAGLVAPGDGTEAELFQPRLVEFGETREEATVSTHAVVREELVVGRTTDRRVERIEETVRRTEVEVEALPPDAGADPARGRKC